jgi:hypothetical protein
MAQPSDSNDVVSKKPKGKGGRPPMILTQSIKDAILLRTAQGESMRALGRDPALPSRDRMLKELVEDSRFAAQYAQAREAMYAGWADEILEIADDGTTDYITKVGRHGHEYEAVDQEHIQRSRLRVDSRKWLLSKLLPKTFGDRVEHEHGGEVAHRVDISGLSEREKMRRMALFMLEDQRAQAIEGETTGPTGPVTKSQQGAAARTVEPIPPSTDEPNV